MLKLSKETTIIFLRALRQVISQYKTIEDTVRNFIKHDLFRLNDKDFALAREYIEENAGPKQKAVLLEALGRIEQMVKEKQRLADQLAAWRAAEITGSPFPEVLYPIPSVVNGRLVFPDGDVPLDEPLIQDLMRWIFKEYPWGVVEVVDGKLRVVEKIGGAEVVVPPAIYPGEFGFSTTVGELIAKALAKHENGAGLQDTRGITFVRQVDGEPVEFTVTLYRDANGADGFECWVRAERGGVSSRRMLRLPLALLELSPEEFAERVASAVKPIADELSAEMARKIGDLKMVREVASRIFQLDNDGRYAWRASKSVGRWQKLEAEAGDELVIRFNGGLMRSPKLLDEAFFFLLRGAELIRIAYEVGSVSDIGTSLSSVIVKFDDARAFARVLEEFNAVLEDGSLENIARSIAQRISGQWTSALIAADVAATVAWAVSLLSLSGYGPDEIASLIGRDVASLAWYSRAQPFADIELYADGVYVNKAKLSEILVSLGADPRAAEEAGARVAGFLCHEGITLIKPNKFHGSDDHVHLARARRSIYYPWRVEWVSN